MKPKTMMLMVVAVGCGLAASYMTSRLLAERQNTQQAEATVQVLVAKQKVPAWVLIKEPEKYFQLKEFPESVAPKKALKEFKDVQGQRLSQPLNEDDFVKAEILVNAEQVGLIAKVPEGMRAVAVKVNAESLVGGFVLPGYHVDVLSTTRGGAKESKSETILQNMLVLAVDTNAQRDPNSQTILGSTVTLAATPEEAQRLSLASALGELRLTLRTPNDTRVVRLAGSKWDDLSKPPRDASSSEDEQAQANAAPPVPKQLPPLPADPPPTVAAKTPVKEPEPEPLESHTMTIINGEYVQKAVFYLDPIEKVWTNGGLGRGGDEAPRRPAAPPQPPSPPAVGPIQPDSNPAAQVPARNGARNERTKQ